MTVRTLQIRLRHLDTRVRRAYTEIRPALLELDSPGMIFEEAGEGIPRPIRMLGVEPEAAAVHLRRARPRFSTLPYLVTAAVLRTAVLAVFETRPLQNVNDSHRLGVLWRSDRAGGLDGGILLAPGHVEDPQSGHERMALAHDPAATWRASTEAPRPFLIGFDARTFDDPNLLIKDAGRPGGIGTFLCDRDCPGEHADLAELEPTRMLLDEQPAIPSAARFIFRVDTLLGSAGEHAPPRLTAADKGIVALRRAA